MLPEIRVSCPFKLNGLVKTLITFSATIFISPDFSIDDLMIGHSYFMAKSKDELQLKLDYEIKPLLVEYVKDGVLFMTNEEMMQITNLSI